MSTHQAAAYSRVEFVGSCLLIIWGPILTVACKIQYRSLVNAGGFKFTVGMIASSVLESILVDGARNGHTTEVLLTGRIGNRLGYLVRE